MSLTQALSSALSGLQVNQAGIALVAANVANADTPGYTRKVMDQVATGTSTSIGVRVSDIQREIDLYIQRQLRIENSGASYADTRARMYSQLQEIYGQPGSATSLEGVYNSFTTALQVLSTSPDDPGARTGVINSAQLLAQQLNQLSSSIQSQRANAELAISDAVNKANEAMSQIASLNQQIAASTPGDAATAALLDNRDAYIDQLSQLMDINVISGDRNQVTIFTNSGTQLVGSQAAQLSFDAVGTMTPQSQWNANPALRGVGTITLIPPAGTPVDLIQNRAIRSGTIAAYLQMRDQDLVQAQTQLDALAAAMAQALSDKAIPSTAVNPAPQAGFDIDTADLLAGNTITINYTDTATSTQHTITLVRVDDPSALPLPNTATATANDTVFGIDFSGGMASVITQINTALTGTGMTASNPSGTTLEILDDGARRYRQRRWPVRDCDGDITGRWQRASFRCLPMVRRLTPEPLLGPGRNSPDWPHASPSIRWSPPTRPISSSISPARPRATARARTSFINSSPQRRRPSRRRPELARLPRHSSARSRPICGNSSASKARPQARPTISSKARMSCSIRCSSDSTMPRASMSTRRWQTC